MIQIYSRFNVSDNSGAKLVFGIKNLTRNTLNCQLGDIILGVVKQSKPHSKIKVSSLIKGLIIRTKIFSKNITFYIKFFSNDLILLDNKNNLIGTRIFGILPQSLLEKNKKLASLANSIL